MQNNILIGVFVLLCFAFAFSLFKNIAYPLLWNDEAETAVFANRILDYGYPKIDDNKNALYLFEAPGKIAWDKKTGAYIGSNWGQYYYSVMGAILAKKENDIYKKTALLRLPFAIIGLTGLGVMTLSAIGLFKKNTSSKLLFLSLFALFELLSIPLILHLREVRYYSPLIFLLACLFYVYINHKFFDPTRYFYYISSTILLMFFLFNTFSPAYFIFSATVILYEFSDFLKNPKIKIRSFIVNMAPFIVSAILTAPLLIFFRTFHISGEYARFAQGYCAPYHIRVFEIVNFFLHYDFLWLVIGIKCILLSLKLYSHPETNRKFQISNLLSLFFVIYVVVIAKMPLPILFQRYYIAIQPILALILLVDLFNAFELISNIKDGNFKRRLKAMFAFLITAIFLLTGINKIEPIKRHFYEITHRYRGPLDFVIPYIKANYKDPERLIIATNYEEPSYMYYLGSKVIVGFVGNNLEEDSKMQPDIIVPRKQRLFGQQRAFAEFLQKGRYRKNSFPVLDYLVNNMPEIGHGRFSHLYKTPLATNENERLDIFIRQ